MNRGEGRAFPYRMVTINAGCVMELGKPPLGSMWKCWLRQESSIEVKRVSEDFAGMGFLHALNISLFKVSVCCKKHLVKPPTTSSPRGRNRHQQQRGASAGMLGNTHVISVRFPPTLTLTMEKHSLHSIRGTFHKTVRWSCFKKCRQHART